MGAVNTTYTFTATDTITSTKMNDIIDQTTFTNDAVFDTTLVVASGKLKVNSQGITSNELAANAVTTAKITDSNVTTVKIADSNVTPAKLSQPLTMGTVQATTSGTGFTFSSIPSWVRRITVMFDAVSTNGGSLYSIQLGDAGGIETFDYKSLLVYTSNTSAYYLNQTGFIFSGGSPPVSTIGQVVISNISGNSWILTGIIYDGTITTGVSSGSKTLSDVLTQIKITTVNGTDVFDNGSVNIMYE